MTFQTNIYTWSHKNVPNKTLLALPSVAGTLTRGLTRFARILAHVLAPQSLALYAKGIRTLSGLKNSKALTYL